MSQAFGTGGKVRAVVWKDKLFWALFLGGLLFYALIPFVGTEMAVAGSALWVMAFSYLVLRSIEKWARGTGGGTSR